MADRIRFHLDEHVSPVVATALRRHGIDVTTTRDASLRTRDDEAHLEYCRQTRRVLVTRDADFLRHANLADHWGIVSCRRRTLSLREVIDGLTLIHAVLMPENMKDHVEYL